MLLLGPLTGLVAAAPSGDGMQTAYFHWMSGALWRRRRRGWGWR